MIRLSGIIYQNNSGKKESKFENLDGDSGVGQASEFPFKSSNFKASSIIILPIFIATSFLLVNSFFDSFKKKNNTPVETGFSQIIKQNLLDELNQVPNPEYSLVIPKLNITSEVVTDVDPFDPDSYKDILIKSVAQAKGSSNPGEKGQVFIFGHSTADMEKVIKYNAVFYNLRELEKGDEIIIYYQKQKYRYFVREKLIVEPTDYTYLDNKKVNQEELILQTCEPPGSGKKRLLIIAIR